MLKVNEIFYSLQGESTYQGLPCVFVRLTGCNLSCSWCDTVYAFYDGFDISTTQLIEEVEKFDTTLVEFTGGEPLLQKKELIPVIEYFINKKYTVLIETNGSITIDNLPASAVKIIDIKLSGSGEKGSFIFENLSLIEKKDEIKFVLNDIIDYNEMKDIISNYNLIDRCKILVSKVDGSAISDEQIAELILKDNLKVRFQKQLHKLIWGNKKENNQ